MIFENMALELLCSKATKKFRGSSKTVLVYKAEVLKCSKGNRFESHE